MNSIKIYDHCFSDCITVSYLNSLLRQNAESRIHENQNTLIWQFCSVICNSRIHENQNTLIWQFCSVICNSRIHENQNTLICSSAQSFAIAKYKQALRKCHFLKLEMSFSKARNSWLKPDDCLWLDPPWFN